MFAKLSFELLNSEVVEGVNWQNLLQDCPRDILSWVLLSIDRINGVWRWILSIAFDCRLKGPFVCLIVVHPEPLLDVFTALITGKIVTIVKLEQVFCQLQARTICS